MQTRNRRLGDQCDFGKHFALQARMIRRTIWVSALCLMRYAALLSSMTMTPGPTGPLRAGAEPYVPRDGVFDASTARCPFTFPEGMQAGVFCVYSGVALGSDGAICGDRMIAIWSRLAEPRRAKPGPGSVYLGFVPFTDFVVRAVSNPTATNQAAIIGYSTDDQEIGASGTAELRFEFVHGGPGFEVLTLRTEQPVLLPSGCGITAYDGTFIGVLAVPPEYDGERIRPPR
jgi:hypothetical protein